MPCQESPLGHTAADASGDSQQAEDEPLSARAVIGDFLRRCPGTDTTIMVDDYDDATRFPSTSSHAARVQSSLHHLLMTHILVHCVPSGTIRAHHYTAIDAPAIQYCHAEANIPAQPSYCDVRLSRDVLLASASMPTDTPAILPVRRLPMHSQSR